MVGTNGISNGMDAKGDEDLSTTTVSTIVVRAGEHAFIVVALLKSLGYVELRIDEMRPGLLAIGGSCEEAAALINIHEDLLARLRDKEDQVTALLVRADNLSTEKKAKEAIIYGDMAKSLNEVWRGLKKQLMLRGYLLREVHVFYQLAQHQEQRASDVRDALKTLAQAQNERDIALTSRKVERMINEIVDITAKAMDVGSSVIAQIRALGQIADTPERPQEILSSCMLIEKVMLRIASEWERMESLWKNEKGKISDTVDELQLIEQWLKHAERRVKAVNDYGSRQLLEEGNAHQTRLAQLSASGAADGARISHLSGKIEEFLYYVRTKMNRSQRIQSFFQSAQTMLSQLSMMAEDMRNANAAMAGELYPLAQQKASAVIYEGKDIYDKEVLTYEERALVKQRCDEMEAKLRALEQLALERQKGTQEISQQLASLQSWNTTRAVPFLVTHSDMGGTFNEAVDFVDAHKAFIQEVLNRDASVVSVLSKQQEMTSVEQNAMREFKDNYEQLKETLNNRVRIGNNFVQVYKFAKDLEASFEALISLLDTNRDFANDQVAGQVDSVFHLIEQTMAQEKHDVERFVKAAEAVANADDKLNVVRSIQAAKNLIIDHDHQFTYVKHKWSEWQRNKAEMRKLTTTIEEIQMWQEDTWEIIRLLENTKTTTLQDSEGLYRRIKELKQTISQQTEKLENLKKQKLTEEISRRIDELLRKQQMMRDRLAELEKKVETIYESFMEQEETKHIRAPQILTSLKDAQVDEGNRFEFVARIEGEPEPKISWFKDGIDVKNNIDYRQDFVNGVASLVIEETFIEDTATYTVRAENAGGMVESSAKLIVKSRSTASSLLEEEKPRFVKQLTNVQVIEGQTAHLDCVVFGRPEPEVIWFKEEKTVQEDERFHLEFTGDHCSLTIERTVPSDTGMYTARARNIYGETTNFCQLKVLPKKQPPPTPPKPVPRLTRAPAFQQTLTATTCEEGETATFQLSAKIFLFRVQVHGEPPPRVEWRFNEQTIQTSETMKIEEESEGLSRLVISPVRPVHAGTYSVVAENEVGETITTATLHVVPPSHSKTEKYEHMVHEEAFERLARPADRREERVDKKETEEFQEFRERISQPLITEQKEVKTTEDYVKEIREEVPAPPLETTTTTTQVSMEFYNAGMYYEKTPPQKQKERASTTSVETVYTAKVQETPQPPETYTATKTSEVVEREHAAVIRRTPAPETHKATITGAVSVENIAAIRQSQAPEYHRATITPGTSVENIATIRRSPAPEMHRSSITRGISVENVATIRQSPAPEMHKSSVTRGVSVENVAAIRQSPAPEIYKASVTSGAPVENVAAIREAPAPETYRPSVSMGSVVENVAAIGTTPAPDAYQATITSTAVENVAAIRKTPIPESGQASLTTATPIVENIAAIQQSEPVHPHTATKTSGVMKANVAQINVPTTQPDVRQFTKSVIPVDRIDDIVVPEYHPHTATDVSQTVTDEGHIYHTDQSFEPLTVTTTERRISGSVSVGDTGTVTLEGGEVTVVAKEQIIDEAAERRRLEEMERELQELEALVPKMSKRVQQTTTAEGWVEHVHDDIAQPQTVRTTKRVETETAESRARQQLETMPATTVTTTQKSKDEELRKLAMHAPSRIPQLSKRVTTVTTADGMVQEIHDDLAQPVKITSTTREGEEAQWQRSVETRRMQPTFEKTSTTTTTSYIQTAASRPSEAATQMRTSERSEVAEERAQYRDSFIAASSEGDGFWTDGAYTGSPSPPPVPKHRTFLEEEFKREEFKTIGESKAATEPEFIRGFYKDYTVDEGGRIVIDCMLVGNPRPKVRFFFNEKEIRKGSEFCEIVSEGDTYSIVIENARLEHSGYYKIVAENMKGQIESLTILHVRPKSMIQYQQKTDYVSPPQRMMDGRPPSEHTRVTEEFAIFEYEQRRPQKHETSRLVTPPPAKRFQAHRKSVETLEQYDVEERQPAGNPPHFTQTLVSTVAAEGESAKFEGIVTGWPVPTVEWSKDGVPFTKNSLPDVDISNIGGRVSLFFKQCNSLHCGKYMCTARNVSGVATSSAQLVVRPKTIAPDFIQRLISQEVVEGNELKWTVRVTGDPRPRVTWLRDGMEIPDCEEVRIIDEGNGVHSLIIVRVEMADSGQFTCLAENVAGEARSTADLVVRSIDGRPGSYFHVTKVTQEKQVQGEQPVRDTAFSIKNPPFQSAML
ncbi:hypothetical protein KIN20_025381 [Parelaphostrongylus tenuis]|uniref:Ig-like domain-containing protein n=1 Tax=Parelaphostrongylus tenuis TaxID=148309 RepID=A0AAD5N982_PARTN|nr:hypothetical protein KIN20_025381 [Parelaphostrongylus tenuis]